MNFKKSIVNYIIWGLLCVIVFAGIGVSAIGVSEAASNPAYLMYVGIFYAIFIIGIAVIALGYKTLKKPLEEKIGLSGLKLEGILEMVFVFVIAITALIVRFSSAITLFLDEASVGTTKGTQAYMEYALGNITNLGTVENGAYLFTGLIKGLFSVFGQNPVVVYVLQAILSLGIMIFVYYALRNAVGKVAAWIALFLLAFLPASVQQFLYCTPALLYAFLLSAYCFGIVELIHFCRNGKIEENRHLVFFGLAGIFAGFIAYFDISGLLLFPITAYAFTQLHYKDKAEIREKIDSPFWRILTFVVCGLGFLLIALLAFPAGAPAGLTGPVRYGMLFVPRDGIDISILSPYYGTWESAIVYMLAGFWLLEFVKAKKDRVFPFSVMAVVFVLFHFVTIDHVSYEAVISLAFVVIGAVGLRYIGILFMPVETESEEAMMEQLIEIENKRREKANQKFAKKIEKQNKQGNHSRTKVITLGKDVHMEAPVDEEESKVPVTAENEPSDIRETELNAIETKETEIKETEIKETEIKETEIKETEIKETENVAEEPAALENLPTADEPVTAEETEISAAPVAVEETVTPAEPVTVDEKETVAEPATAETKPVKKELPPYVPMKLAPRGRRGKLFSPIKKAEGDFESNPEYMNRPMPTTRVDEFGNVLVNGTIQTEEVKSEEVKPETVKAEEVKTEEVKTEEVKAEEVKAEEVKTEENQPEEIKPEEFVTADEETDKAGADEVQAEEKPVEETATEEKTVEETAAEEKTVEETAVEEKTVEETAVEEKAVEETAVEETAAEETAVEEKAVEENKVKEIKNVLPGPKPHVPKELVFDYDPTDEEMDFDIKDLTGKDFYDV
ncbi:MAG: hypothetical protein K5879_09775 [Lachnospiraceae bacterium]|nr:hypothetical protein [Lachnospiraceae bacterium]